MFKNLTYKQKFFAVIGGFILLFMASYKKSFKHTLIANMELNRVEEKLSNIENLFNEIYDLKKEINYLDNIIGGHTLNPELVQQKVFDFITKSEFKVNIVSIENVHLFSDKDFLIYSNQIEMEGSYKTLVNLLYDIEKNFKNSRVINTQFYSKKNYRTNIKNLFLKIIIQNYEKIK